MSKSPSRWNLREWMKTWKILGRLPMSRSNAKQIQRLYWKLYILGNAPEVDGCVGAGHLLWHYTSRDHLLRLFQEIFLEQSYAFVAPSASPRIIDCGANIGMSLLYFKMCHPDAHITAFEPDKKALACCRRNIDENKMQSIELHDAAVSSSKGTVSFYTEEQNPGSLTATTVRPRANDSMECLVPAVLLSDYIEDEVDFLKMDIEGAELGVIQQLAESGKLRSIKQMAVEYHHHLHPAEDRLSDFFGVLENAGFGCQMQTRFFRRPFSGPRFQDILIYAYRK